jgi:NhaP-type Na+/H+ or K+/H+ antiporter
LFADVIPSWLTSSIRFHSSLLVGVASGMLGTVYYWIFYGCQTSLVEVLMFFCWALLPYYICDGIGWSGIVASVAVGFVMDLHILGQRRPSPTLAEDGENQIMDHSERSAAYDANGVQKEKPVERLRRRIFSSSPGHLSHEAKTHIGFVTEIISTAMETAIFAYLGFFLFSHRYHWNAFHMIIAVLGCCLSRAAMIPSLGMVANWITRIQQRSAQCKAQASPAGAAKKTVGVVIDRKMQIVLWFAGLRGAMSFALVEHIPLYDSYSGEGTRLKPELKAMTSASIIFTVFVLGGYTYYIMEKLGVAPSSRSANGLGLEGVSLTRNPGSHRPDDDEDGTISNMSDAKSSHATTFRRKHNTILSV